MNDHRKTSDINPASDELLDAVVIGGGQAGLAIGFHLAQQRRRFVILDELPRVGDAWRRRWDSLRLFTPARFDALPGTPVPGDRLGFPTKDELADYLEAYADRHALPVLTGVHVDALRRDGDMFSITSGDRTWTARRVVVATGANRIPRIPEFASRLAASVMQLHSAAYRNPAQLQPGPVLVVGFGNSGAEIALELSRTHPTSISGAPSGELPVRHGRAAARAVFPIVRFMGLHMLTWGTPIGRRVLPKLEGRAIPLIRTKRKQLAAAGVTTVARVADVTDGMPVLADGRQLDVSNVIWCTGFRTDFGWIDAPAFDEAGRFRQWRGVVESVPGLYTLGQDRMYSLASDNLPGTVRDAAYLAKRIAAGLHGASSGSAASNSASHTAALPSEGARQSPRGDSDPAGETFGPFGIAERLN